MSVSTETPGERETPHERQDQLQRQGSLQNEGSLQGQGGVESGFGFDGPSDATSGGPRDAHWGGFLSTYRPPAGVYDEMVDAAGELRAPWRKLIPALDRLGPEGLVRQTEQARRLLRDNGVTYNVYGESTTADRPWELDCVPLVISGDEWSGLAAGL